MFSAEKDEANGLPSGCRVVAKWLPSGCRVVAEWLPSGCRVVAEWLQSGERKAAFFFQYSASFRRSPLFFDKYDAFSQNYYCFQLFEQKRRSGTVFLTNMKFDLTIIYTERALKEPPK